MSESSTPRVPTDRNINVSVYNYNNEKKLRKGVFFGRSDDTDPRKTFYMIFEVIQAFFGMTAK